METLILIIIINISLVAVVWVGINHFDNKSRIESARERAKKQYRDRGRFSKNEIMEQTPIFRRIKINEYGKTYFI